MQQTLPFDGDANEGGAPDIPGLTYRPDYVTEEEERALLLAVDAAPWRAQWQRRTQHYGFGYPEGGSRFATPVQVAPIPEWLAAVGARLVADGLLGARVDNVVVNEYLPGQGIGPHRDVPAYEEVVSLSLGSPCVMDLVRLDGGAARELLLAPRSALALAGEARWGWTHGIARRRIDRWRGRRVPRGRRVSLTFRTLRAST